MGRKVENLQKLLHDKINVHDFEEINTYEKLKKYREQHQQFSIRFDRKEKIKSLPFYIYDQDQNYLSDNALKEIIFKMQQLECTLLCSDGHQYDSSLKFNFVIDIDQDYNFILELCDQKVPLRMMYKYKTTIIKGNIFSSKYEYINKDANKFTLNDIEYLLDTFAPKTYKYIEGSLYDTEVGILKEKYVIWQTD